jgi:hypothetical protein
MSSSGAHGASFSDLVRLGMQLFRSNEVEASLRLFDEALVLDASKRAYLWQRGIALFYMNDYERGAVQFRHDVAVNPNDTEESIWALLCEAKLGGFEQAQASMLVVGQDSRPVMRAAYSLFSGRGSLEGLQKAGASGRLHDAFYSLLYEGLYFEARGDTLRAKDAILRSLQVAYAKESDDYMVSVAAVHVKRRNWDLSDVGAAAATTGGGGGVVEVSGDQVDRAEVSNESDKNCNTT